ncbi:MULTISPECIES: transcriptional regulator domain-containing protein [Xanthobacter]|uniref:transcriptional regulator domain-containing protein n=1 Tax=Xanthobacter TaxID=279 RepID=UPI00372D05E9
MSLDTSRWRSQSTYDYVDALTAPDIGWEWLRRNEDYQSSYAAFSQAEHPAPALTEGAARKWGLRFPGRSGA